MTRAIKMPPPGKGPRQGRMGETHEDTSMIPQNQQICKGVTFSCARVRFSVGDPTGTGPL